MNILALQGKEDLSKMARYLGTPETKNHYLNLNIFLKLYKNVDSFVIFIYL